jgi:NAD(P)H-dependent FMN reductase
MGAATGGMLHRRLMSMLASDPVKMRAARDWVVAVIATSAGAGGGLAVTDHWKPLLSAR